MTKKLRVVLAQLNFMMGDFPGNLNKMIDAATRARDEFSADIIVFPELCVTAYPPEDLLLRKSFINDANKALYEFIARVNNIHCIVSHPHATPQGLLNAISVIHNGTILARYGKQHLPNYGVFDEARYFIPGNAPCVVPINGIPVGIVICEDLWLPNPSEQAATQGARFILSPNASPFEIDKHEKRLDVISARAKSTNIPIAYVNLIGGQDELVFDGGSMIVDAEGKLCHHAGFFNETLLAVDFEITNAQTHVAAVPIHLPSTEKNIYDALVLGLRDYVEKNNIPGVIIGVSGGIDSALTLAIAVDALGKEKVEAVFMPSCYSAEISKQDAFAVAKNLSVDCKTISIETVFESFIHLLSPNFQEKKPTISEENIQSRCRCIILMALSNQSGKIVLSTGNRSELAVGYSTLYGDMSGGFAVLKDVPKTLIYTLAQYRNEIKKVIPQRIIDRPPTAELSPNQKDEDSLPPYSILDKILFLYLNQELSAEEIIAEGFDAAVVEKVIKLIKRNEYKRRQAPIGTHINHKSFGKDWRYPITAK